jgi:hypothetical protein
MACKRKAYPVDRAVQVREWLRDKKGVQGARIEYCPQCKAWHVRQAQWAKNLRRN